MRDRFNQEKIKQFLHYNIWIILLDIIAFCVSYLLALYIRLYVNGVFRYGLYYLDFFWSYIPYYAAAALLVFAVFRLYGGMWQYAGLHDLNRLIVANLITAVLNYGVSVLVISLTAGPDAMASRMPVSYYIIGAVIQMAVTSSVRFANRLFQAERKRINNRNGLSVLLVGTGETSRTVRRQLEEDPDSGVRIVCIFTYKDSEVGSLIDGIPVVGHVDHFKDHLEKYAVKRVILADPFIPASIREQIRTSCKDAGTEIQDFSGFLRYDNHGLSFRSLMECTEGPITILQDGKVSHFDNGEQALMTIVDRHDVKSVSVRENGLFVELISYKVNPLIVFYITNRPDVALVAEKYGVDRVWVDLETRGKEQRQRNLNTVKSHHSISDIAEIKPLLTRAEMMVRVNPWYEGSQEEIDAVIAAGADIIMLPYWKTADEVRSFLGAVHGRCKTSLLLETKEAVECIDEVLEVGGFDEIHIGLNDLHLSYGMSFMFEPLSNGTVEMLCKKFQYAGVPYGFGGIAKLGDGMLPSERIIMEHYRLGSTRAILSRSFCDTSKIEDIEEIDRIFRENMEKLREYEISMANTTTEEFVRNKAEIKKAVNEIAEKIEYARSNGL